MHASKTFMIGDSTANMAAARKAGTNAIGVASSTHPKYIWALFHYGAEVILDRNHFASDPIETCAFLKGLADFEQVRMAENHAGANTPLHHAHRNTGQPLRL